MEEVTYSHFDIDIDPEKAEYEFLQILKQIQPQWKEEDIVFERSPKKISRGVLNTMIKCYNKEEPKDAIMIRIPNTRMGALVDRPFEVKCIKVLQRLDCAPKIVATFANGFCYQFYHGEILNSSRLTEEPIWRLIATDIAKFHSVDLNDSSKEASTGRLEEIIQKFWDGYPDELKNPDKDKIFKRDFPPKEEFQVAIDVLRKHCLQFNSPLVLCHNDTRAENIIWNEETQRIHFVDFEGISYNYQANEIAAHFVRFCGFTAPDFSSMPDEGFQMNWLRFYLEKYYEFIGRDPEVITEKDVRTLFVQVQKYFLLQLIFCGMIGPMFESMNILPESDEELNLLEFSLLCIKHYHKLKETVWAMTLPE